MAVLKAPLVFCMSSSAVAWYSGWKRVSHEKREEPSWNKRTGHLLRKVVSRSWVLVPTDFKSCRIMDFSYELNSPSLESRSLRKSTTVSTSSWRMSIISSASAAEMVSVFYIYEDWNQTPGCPGQNTEGYLSIRIGAVDHLLSFCEFLLKSLKFAYEL